MSKEAPISKQLYGLLPTDIEGFDSLAELAPNMRWSWNHATDEVWRQLDPALWDITHDPWVVLQTASRDQIERITLDGTVGDLKAKTSAEHDAKNMTGVWRVHNFLKVRL
jgi:hypothetical protein